MRILLVEDDGMIGEGLQTALRQGGFAVDWTGDGPSAAYALQSAAFDLQQRRRLTADVLRIHPNTLNYRLERIEQLLGAKMNDAGWIAKLYVAIRLRQASMGDAGA